MPPIDIALSGIQSAHRRIETSAHNIANLGTDGFRPQRAQQLSRAEGGSEVRVCNKGSPGEVDIARELVDQKLAQHQAEASARVIRTVDEMQGHLIDLFA